ncbi:MAG: hypothetical protein QHJ82_12635 [Verrucomicrobiota bacterium]|nr:hypothetical protein [Verrucomicrobiota bacterium]
MYWVKVSERRLKPSEVIWRELHAYVQVPCDQSGTVHDGSLPTNEHKFNTMSNQPFKKVQQVVHGVVLLPFRESSEAAGRLGSP